MDVEAEDKVIERWAKPPDEAAVRLLRGCDLVPEPVLWLWGGWLARGKFHVIAGAPGTGKTTLALALAATITTGGRWPDGTHAAAGNVLIWSGEDGVRDTLLPRLLAMGADPSRLYFVGDVEVGAIRRPFDPSLDMAALAREAATIGDVRLLIVDPIANVVPGDSNKNSETRRSLQPVVDLAAKLQAAALGVSHFSKGTVGRDPIERVTGSLAFGALPRLVWGTAKKTEEDGTAGRLLVRAKSNIGPDGGGYSYQLQQQPVPGVVGLSASTVLWGNALQGEARELLATAEVNEDQEERQATDGAENWLRKVLLAEGGEMFSRDALAAAKDAGIAERTLQRARTRLGVMVKPSGFGKDRKSLWTLPVPAIPAIPASPERLANMADMAGAGTRASDTVEEAV